MIEKKGFWEAISDMLDALYTRNVRSARVMTRHGTPSDDISSTKGPKA